MQSRNRSFALGREKPLLLQRLGSFVDGCHHFTGSRLLDHMAGAGNAVHFALPDFAM
jgi:hypothetical protein